MRTLTKKQRDAALRSYNAYDETAKREGWAVFTSDERELRILRMDDKSLVKGMRHRPSDAAAVAYVRRRARNGSKPHRAALLLHGTEA